MTSEHVKKVLVGMGVILAVSILITFAFGRTSPTSTPPTMPAVPVMPIADVPDEPAVPEPISPPDEGVMCTMDAKICPDGSAVGRSGPNCEFAPCPKQGAPIVPDEGFQRCVAAGNPVMESYPRRCMMDGTTYMEPIDPTIPEPY